MELRNKRFRTHLLASAATGFALMFNAGSALAQDEQAADEAVEEIVIKGFRSSIENAIATKKTSSSIVEAISAEDIGKLPDVSIAESLGRLPGLATQRLDGRAQVLSIRGLGPDLSTALLNGREQVSTSDNRGVEYDQYPSELLTAAVVYKTPDASLIGQGLAGTVDLRTIRPLEKNERILSANARYELNGNGSLNPDSPSGGIRGSVTYVDQFAGDTIGVAFGFAYQSTPTQNERYNAWGYPSIGNRDEPEGLPPVPYFDNAGNPAPTDTLVLGGAKPFVQSNDLDRYGLIGILEFEPNSDFNTSIDLYYSDFKEEVRLRGIEFPLQWAGVGGDLRDGFTIENGRVVDGTFDNVFAVVRNDYNRRDAELFAAGWNTKYTINEDWAVELDLSYSRAERDDELVESYSGTGYAGNGQPNSVRIRQLDNGLTTFESALDYGNRDLFVLTDPQGWGRGAGFVQAGFINSPETIDELTHLRGSVDRQLDLGFVSSVEVGVDLSRRDKERNIDQDFLTLAGTTTLDDGTVLVGGSSAPIPQEALLGRQVGLEFLGVPSQVTYDPLYLLNNGILIRNPAELSSFDVPQSWEVREDILVAYAKFEVDSQVGDIPVIGNFGVQFVYTDQSSQGSRVLAGAETPEFIDFEDGDKYSHWLPSLNLIFSVADDTQVRFGAARTLARARPDQINASLSLRTNDERRGSTDPAQGFFSANGGNPRLKPTISNSVDLSIEHYFGGSGYVAFAAFYKDLQDFVNESDGVFFDFAEFADDFPGDGPIGTTIGTISGPTNDGRGHIKGFEFTASVPLELIADPLEGFGLISSASYTDSKVLLGDNTDPITVRGLSKWVVNSTAYFEKHGFQARISHRYRSGFLAEVSGISAQRIFRSAKNESIFDAQVGYSFEEGVFDGLTVTFQANNLTDEPFTTFDTGQGPSSVIDHQSFGRNFVIGASYTF